MRRNKIDMLDTVVTESTATGQLYLRILDSAFLFQDGSSRRFGSAAGTAADVGSWHFVSDLTKAQRRSVVFR
jgi:hypothetical protein